MLPIHAHNRVLRPISSAVFFSSLIPNLFQLHACCCDQPVSPDLRTLLQYVLTLRCLLAAGDGEERGSRLQQVAAVLCSDSTVPADNLPSPSLS